MIFVVTFLAFAAIMAAMAVGGIAGRSPISGTCGGIGNLGIDSKCELCGGDPQVCETETRASVSSSEVQTHDPRD